MNLKTIYNKITKDTHAVSPVVATLVLVVVAIIGAAAVGAMTGAFTEDVGGQEADIAVTGGSLIIAGSTTVEPVASEIAKGFMELNPGVKITVQAGGSGAGISAVGRDVVDIGMSSRNLTATDLANFPALVGREVTIGNSTVVLVGHSGLTQATLDALTIAEIRDLFVNDTLPAGITRGIARMDRSGTGDEFASLIGTTHDAIHAGNNTNVRFGNGNAGVLELIRTTTGAIGGVDIGYIAKAPTGTITSSTNLALRRDRPLVMVTNGEPSRLEQAFFDYARSPGAIPHFTEVGVRSIVQ